MQHKSFFRLGIALVLSASCWLGTEYYYRKSQTKPHDHGNAKPIAFVSDISEEVERRPVTRIVWNLLSKGDPVFPGEMIKTSDLGEATIQFADSTRFLNLEPDSLIVLSQNSNNEISLDLMDGNIYVGQSKETPGSASENSAKPLTLTLKSDSKTVDLSQATAQLSKSKGKSINIQVLQGKAKVDGDGKTQELDAKKSLGAIEIIAPALDKPIFLNPENPEVVNFKWKGFPSDTVVQLWVGKTRKAMKFSGTFAEQNIDFLNAKIPPGKHFWKLVALRKTNNEAVAESSVFRTEVIARYAPAVINPLMDAKVILPLPTAATEFAWTRPADVQSVYLEIAKDPALREKVATQILATENTFSYSLAPGVYYWRLSASYPDSSKTISSKVFKFNVDLKKAEPPKPPVIIGWQDADKNSQFFVTEPQLSLAWGSAQKDQIKSWRLKISDSEENLTNPNAGELVQTIETEQPQAKATVAKPGRYIAMVEALDEKNEVLASSPPKAMDVIPLPLIAAPIFQPAKGNLQANNQGRLELAWSKIDGAKEYWLTLADNSGKEIRKAKFVGNSTALVNLLPGEYKVSVFAIDQHGRESQKEQARSVLVPEGSGLSAPKLKKVKVD